MAKLINSTPLNVPTPATASGMLAPVKSTPPVLEARAPQLAVAGHTAGLLTYATPHTAATVTAATVTNTKGK